MLSVGPRRRPGSCAYASLGPPQWTWRSLAVLRNKFSACLVLPVRRKLDFTEQQSFLAIGGARHNTLIPSSKWSTEAVSHSCAWPWTPKRSRLFFCVGFSGRKRFIALFPGRLFYLVTIRRNGGKHAYLRHTLAPGRRLSLKTLGPTWLITLMREVISS